MSRYKIAIPFIVQWALGAVGGTKWLRERALHVDEAALPDAAALAGVTPAQWRAVEEVQVRLLTYGILRKAGG